MFDFLSKRGRDNSHDKIVEDVSQSPIVTPAPPPENTPLDETAAPVHYEGDTNSV